MASEQQAFRILLLGIGTVGGAVLRILQKQHHNIQVAAVMSRDAGQCLQTQAPEYLQKLSKKQIFNSWANLKAALKHIGRFDAVIELTGGIDNCLPIYRHFLQRGISIITANKALLAEHGAELFPLARKHQTFIACEASCGGGIPILQTLLYGLRANHIHEFHGVLNGTCNFILSQMAIRGCDYAEVLHEAQACGLAEANPFLDVSGIDTAHKLLLLSMMSFGHSLTLEDIPISGIDTLNKVHILAGQKLGFSLKLLASAKLYQSSLENSEISIALRVGPYYIPKQSGQHQQLNIQLLASPLASLTDSFNGISLYGNNIGHIYLEGRGAGASATASAVLSDLYQIQNGSYPLAFADFPNWPQPKKLKQQNQWAQLPQNWLGFAPNTSISQPIKGELFELDGYRIFFQEQSCQEQLTNIESSSYIPILQLPEEQLQGQEN